MEHFSIEERIRIGLVDLPGNLPPVQQSGSVERLNNATLFSIKQTHSIRSVCLRRYLWEHLTPVPVTQFNRSETWCSRGNNINVALAFSADAGGFNPVIPDRHYHRSARDITLNPNGFRANPVFRQIFDPLSYVPIFTGPIRNFLDFLVVIALHRPKQLLLPNDIAGTSLITFPARILKHRRHRGLPIQASAVLPAGFVVLEPANAPKSCHLASRRKRYHHLSNSP
jgi:hypothetical protein